MSVFRKKSKEVPVSTFTLLYEKKKNGMVTIAAPGNMFHGECGNGPVEWHYSSRRLSISCRKCETVITEINIDDQLSIKIINTIEKNETLELPEKKHYGDYHRVFRIEQIILAPIRKHD